MKNRVKLDKNELEQTYGRRQILRSILKSTAVGALAATGTFKVAELGMNYIGKTHLEGLEKRIRKATLDLEVLAGIPIKKLRQANKELQHYVENEKLEVFKCAKEFDPNDLLRLEKIIENNEYFIDDQNALERIKTFKDRIDLRLLNTGEALLKWQPKVGESMYDKFAEWVQRTDAARKKEEYVKKGRTKIEKERTAHKAKLTRLVEIYDTNDDLRTADTKVIEEINKNIKDAQLPREEKELWNFLKDQYQETERREPLRKFIRNYDEIGEKEYVFLKLRESLTEVEKIYETMHSNLDDAEEFQELLHEGITRRKEIRTSLENKTQEFTTEADQATQAFIDTVYTTIERVEEEKGYDIETRKEYIEDTIIPNLFGWAKTPVAATAATVTGITTATGTLYLSFKKATEKALRKALGHSVKTNNLAVNEANALKEKLDQTNAQLAKTTTKLITERNKKPETPNYNIRPGEYY